MHVHTLHMGCCFTLHSHAATDVDSWNKPDSVHKMCFKIQNEIDIDGDLQILYKKKKKIQDFVFLLILIIITRLITEFSSLLNRQL